MTYQVSLPVFEGPFELLVHLIEKNQVDIYDIPIAKITEEYLAYLKQMEELDLDLASSFLLMAAHLLSIKARMLLPRPPKAGDPETTGELEEDPRQELVDRLLEYRRYKAVAEILKSQERDQSRVFSRVVDPASLAHLFREENPLEGVMMGDLLEALRRVLNQKDKEEPVADIPKEEISVQQKIDDLMTLISNRRGNEPLSFIALFSGTRRRSDVIVTFLALLELVRLKKVRVIQRKTLGEIFILSCMD